MWTAKVSTSMIWGFSKEPCGFARSAAFLGVRGEGAYAVNYLTNVRDGLDNVFGTPLMLSVDGIV